MALDLDSLPDDARDEIERLRAVNTSMSSYLRLLEGALLAAWTAGEPARTDLAARPPDALDEDERRLSDAWQLVGEIVLRIPEQRGAGGGR